MKHFISILAVVVLMVGTALAQKVDYQIPDVRDPVRLTRYLNTDGANIEVRLGVLEARGITNTTAAVTVGSLTTTGGVTIAEGALADSTVVTADIKDGTIANADISASAAIVASKLATYFTGAITNASTLMTNVTLYLNGVVTNNVHTGP